jgi:hypothetical protein
VLGSWFLIFSNKAIFPVSVKSSNHFCMYLKCLNGNIAAHTTPLKHAVIERHIEAHYLRSLTLTTPTTPTIAEDPRDARDNIILMASCHNGTKALLLPSLRSCKSIDTKLLLPAPTARPASAYCSPHWKNCLQQ